jgi:NADPH:quinone reductase-like Zn-dependent oxidoreductase
MVIGIGIEQYGDEDQIKVVALPTAEVGPDDLLIAIRASGVNPVDWKVRKGLLKQVIPYELPLILGWDAAGKVAAVGSRVTDFRVGDDVFFRPELEKQGTYADEIVVPARFVAPMPHGLTYEEAASLPLVGLTVWQALVEEGGIRTGDRVLILGGSGGTGSIAIQMAKAFGAYVAATASARNREFVRSLGADEVIAYDDDDGVERAAQFDFMFDTVGGTSYAHALRWMKPKGIVATIINERDAVRADDAEAWEKKRQLVVKYVFTRPDGNNLNRIRELVETQNIKPVIATILPLTVEGIREAHRMSQAGRTRGKIVVSQGI